MDLRERRELNNGFGRTFSRAFELAGTMGIFLGIGWLADRALGTKPVFMILLFLFVVAGQGYLMWKQYDAEMQGHEADAVWNRNRTRRPAATRDLPAPSRNVSA